jgi:hypothetical protein
MTWLAQQYKEHSLTPGTRVIRISATYESGSKFSRLYLYDTGASFIEAELRHLPDFARTEEPWNGEEHVNVCCGD